MNFWYIEYTVRMILMLTQTYGLDMPLYLSTSYFMNFWYIEHYAASVGDDFVAIKT